MNIKKLFILASCLILLSTSVFSAQKIKVSQIENFYSSVSNVTDTISLSDVVSVDNTPGNDFDMEGLYTLINMPWSTTASNAIPYDQITNLIDTLVITPDLATVLTAGADASADINMEGLYSITNLADAVDDTDAAPWGQMTNWVYDNDMWHWETYNEYEATITRASYTSIGGIVPFGQYAHAEGWSPNATGYCAHAEGFNTTSQGQGSHSEGFNTTSRGVGSHAEGHYTIATNKGSHSEGYSLNDVNILSYGLGSHAEGATSDGSGSEDGVIKSSGIGSHAEGYAKETTSGTIGRIYSLGEGSHAEGYAEDGGYVLAWGKGAHAEGWNTFASNDATHAEGHETVATGLVSHAAGKWSAATSDYSWVWADGSASKLSPYADNGTKTFNVYAANGSYFDGGFVYNTNIAISADQLVNYQTLTNHAATKTLGQVMTAGNTASINLDMNSEGIDDIAYLTGYNGNAPTIGANAYGAVVLSSWNLEAGDRLEISPGGIGSMILGNGNEADAWIGTNAAGALIVGEAGAGGDRSIGNEADGAVIRGYIESGTASVSGKGSMLLMNLSGQSASITGNASLGLGAVTVSNDQAIVIGDGNESHGNGSMTADSFHGDGSGLTNMIGLITERISGAGAASVYERAIFSAPAGGCTITSIKIVPDVTIPTQITDYTAIQIIDKGVAGAGTIAVASYGFDGVNPAATKWDSLSLGTVSNNVLAADDTLTIKKTNTGNGQALPDYTVVIEYTN